MGSFKNEDKTLYKLTLHCPQETQTTQVRSNLILKAPGGQVTTTCANAGIELQVLVPLTTQKTAVPN